MLFDTYNTKTLPEDNVNPLINKFLEINNDKNISDTKNLTTNFEKQSSDDDNYNSDSGIDSDLLKQIVKKKKMMMMMMMKMISALKKNKSKKLQMIVR